MIEHVAVNLTLKERVASLESVVRDMKAAQVSTNEKLDQLLSLRDKGTGAFWLASILFGTGIVGSISLFIDWVKG